jgi:hypothetical protein
MGLSTEAYVDSGPFIGYRTKLLENFKGTYYLEGAKDAKEAGVNEGRWLRIQFSPRFQSQKQERFSKFASENVASGLRMSQEPPLPALHKIPDNLAGNCAGLGGFVQRVLIYDR